MSLSSAKIRKKIGIMKKIVIFLLCICTENKLFFRRKQIVFPAKTSCFSKENKLFFCQIQTQNNHSYSFFFEKSMLK